MTEKQKQKAFLEKHIADLQKTLTDVQAKWRGKQKELRDKAAGSDGDFCHEEYKREQLKFEDVKRGLEMDRVEAMEKLIKLTNSGS